MTSIRPQNTAKTRNLATIRTHVQSGPERGGTNSGRGLIDWIGVD